MTWQLSPDAWDREDYDFFDLFDHERPNATRLYMLVLYGLIRSNGWRVLIELGGYRGNTTAILARAATRNGGHVHVYESDSWCAAHLRDRFSSDPRVFVHQSRSQEAVTLAERPDFIFVDSEHTYDGAAGDIFKWAPQLLPGGLMAFHDVTTDPDILKAATTLLPWPAEHITFPGDYGLHLARRLP